MQKKKSKSVKVASCTKEGTLSVTSKITFPKKNTVTVWGKKVDTTNMPK